jgi:hypothetical protein
VQNNLQGVGRPRNAGPQKSAQGSENVTDLLIARPVLVQGNPLLGVLDRDTPDCLVDAILEHVSASIIATNMVDNAKEGNPIVAHDLLQEFNNAPTALRAAADLELAADECDGEVPHVALGEPPSKQLKKEAHSRFNSADACKKTFRRRHTLLRMSICRADASESQIRKNVARHFKRFAMEDPLMTAEVCSILKTWRSLQSRAVSIFHATAFIDNTADGVM